MEIMLFDEVAMIVLVEELVINFMPQKRLETSLLRLWRRTWGFRKIKINNHNQMETLLKNLL
jgi:hypothetical protein